MCASFELSATANTNIHTDFRFELELYDDTNQSTLGLNKNLTAYITQCDLPCAPGEGIPWYMPGGMRNWQAGPRRTKDISLTFVVNSDQTQSWIRTLQKWGNACYNLNDGSNAGKAGYSVDAIVIKVKSEEAASSGSNKNVNYVFRLKRAQITDVNYGTLNSEGNGLLNVTCTIIYDNYEVRNGSGALIEEGTNF